MLEGIVEFGKEVWPYLLVLLPYLGTIVVVAQIMKRFIKPTISSHRRGKKGKFRSQFWASAHKLMVFYPMLLGAACGGLCIATGIGGHILAYIASGAVAQLAYREYLHWSEKRGIIGK